MCHTATLLTTNPTRIGMGNFDCKYMFDADIRIIWHHFQQYDCFIPKLFKGTVLSAAVLFVLSWYLSGVTEENHFKPSQIYVAPSNFLYLYILQCLQIRK